MLTHFDARTESIAASIVDSAFRVHKEVGPGLLESIYETCFCYELELHGLQFRRQVRLPITYRDRIFDSHLRLDVLVEDLVVCEIKSVELILPVHQAQIISHLKLCSKRLGFLINFNAPVMKAGLRRFIV